MSFRTIAALLSYGASGDRFTHLKPIYKLGSS
jgi:hypothetical protein